jgi:hypothetical protein
MERNIKNGGMMKKRILVLFALVIVLTACGPQATPVPEPAAPTPEPTATLEMYPPPSAPQQAYPGPDAPVFSGAYPSPLEPLPDEESMTRGEVFIDQMDILTMESFPPQFLLQVRGSLPTPCHHLRAEVSEPDAQNRIQVEVFSLADPDEACIQVLEPFQQGINLGSFPQGSYTVIVNGEQVAEIEAP